MNNVKRIAKRVLFVYPLYRKLRRWYARYRLRSRTPADIFTEIYRNNAWEGKDSVSGLGSDREYTETIVRGLPRLFCEYRISTILDIPCGDFFWMKSVEREQIDYTGADIVADLIRENTARHANEHVRFLQLNLIQDALPSTDLVICRDCLVHLSFADILHALRNLCESNSVYLLTTTFTARKSNYDIATGQWRTLNLQLAPFNLPGPLFVLHEMPWKSIDGFGDKALGLWKISDIRECLRENGAL